ncbi:MAG: hypothetical protein D6731_15890 [Planctomycetota bacterium]|nr:MAG: hypothetical protein D6731_15890 [Planctomycetota bacterium]
MAEPASGAGASGPEGGGSADAGAREGASPLRADREPCQPAPRASEPPEASAEEGPEASAEAGPEATPPWEPPWTFADHFSVWSRRLLRGTLALAGGVVAVCLLLWAVPAVLVATSSDYALLRRRVEADRLLRTYLGAPLRCERVPTRYRPVPGGTRYVVVVEGSLGRALVEAEVVGGEVRRYQRRIAVDWSRPLLWTLGPSGP